MTLASHGPFSLFNRQTRRRTTQHDCVWRLPETLESRLVCSANAVGPLEVPTYHTSLDSPVVLYLDFVGDDTSTWNDLHPGTTPAFDIDGDPTTFSDVEQILIREIQFRVQYTFIPLDIDTTTEDPGPGRADQTLHIVIGGDGAWAGAVPGHGISELDSFANPDLDNLAFAFMQEGFNTTPDYHSTQLLEESVADFTKAMAVSIAQQAGHAFGLQYQRTFNPDGSVLSERNSGDASRAPIMGSAAQADRAVWWIGPTEGPNVIQDDLAVLTREANGFGYRRDESDGTIAGALILGQSIYGNYFTGTITTTSDVDTFGFNHLTAGSVTFQTTVPRSLNMLDPAFDVLNATGQVIATSDSSSLSETLILDLPAGQYYVAVRSHGAIGDVGAYSIGVIPIAESPVLINVKTPKVAPIDGDIAIKLKHAFDREGKILSIEFFIDYDNNGVFNPGFDPSLGSRTQYKKQTGVSTTFPAEFFGPGIHTLFIVPRDENGGFGRPQTVTIRVQTPLRLTATPTLVDSGETINLTANDALFYDTEVQNVAFYRDANFNRKIDKHDVLINLDSDSSDGWSAVVPTTDLGLGPQWFMARATGAKRKAQAVAKADVFINVLSN